MKHFIPYLILALVLVSACESSDSHPYPDEPVVDYQGFSLFIMEDQLGNLSLTGRIRFDFTDGDGNVGLPPLPENTEPTLPDSVKYNFFLQLYDLQGYEYVKIPESEGGVLKYRIPELDKQPTSGTMELDISYPIIIHDTIFYTFFIMDRAYNRSNTDTTEVVVLSTDYLEPEDEGSD